MKRATSIKALLKRASSDAAGLKPAYEASLAQKNVNDELKVAIKNIFENLRSCLDYMAHDAFDTFCGGATTPGKLYFPIRSTAPEFEQAIAKDFPGHVVVAPLIFQPVAQRDGLSQ